VHHNIELFHLPTLMYNSLFINNMYVTLHVALHVEDSSVAYISLMNKELCKLVNEIILEGNITISKL
jgi:hypothetical protein